MISAGQITILGTGLLGGSIGLGLKAGGYTGRIVGCGRRRETVERALARGCVDEVAADLPSAVAQADLVILATPIGQFDALLRQLGRAGRPTLACTDVGSTKTWVCERARAALPLPRYKRFIGAHPMAGGDQQGPDAARADLFRNRPCIVTPQADADPQALQLVESLWQSLGMRLLRMSAAEHDQLVADVSHLPHALAALLVDLARRDGGLPVASTGFRDLTRIAGSDPHLWVDVFATNRPAVADAIGRLQEMLSAFKKALDAGDDKTVQELLHRAKEARDRWVRTFEEGNNE